MFPEKTNELKITVDLVAEMAVINPFDFFLEPRAETIPFDYEEWQTAELAPYLQKLPETPEFRKWMTTIDRKETPSVDFLVGVNQRVADRIDYLIRMEPGVQTPEETLKKAPDPAGIPPGCWFRRFGIWGWRRGSCPVT